MRFDESLYKNKWKRSENLILSSEKAIKLSGTMLIGQIVTTDTILIYGQKRINTYLILVQQLASKLTSPSDANFAKE